MMWLVDNGFWVRIISNSVSIVFLMVWAGIISDTSLILSPGSLGQLLITIAAAHNAPH